MSDNPFLFPQSDKRTPQSNLFGMYEGTVEYVGDPKNRGRVKVRIAGIHNPDPQTTPYTDLPWAYPSFAPGSFRVPTVGSAVWILFRQGDVNYPVYMGTWPGERANASVRGRLPYLGDVEPKTESTQLTVTSLTGAGTPGDLQFVASTKQIRKRSGGLAAFFINSDISITGASESSNNGTFRISSLSDTSLVLAGDLFDEDSSTATISAVVAPPAANNYKSFAIPGGNDAPSESFHLKTTTDPTVHVIFKSDKGTTLYYVDDDEHERTVLMDRGGQQLIMACPVTQEANQFNLARRLGEAVDNQGLDLSKVTNNNSYIKVVDLLGQYFFLSADGNGGSVVELFSPNIGFIKLQEDGELITIKSNKGSTILIDDNIVCTSNGNAKATLDSTGTATVESSSGSKCTLDKSGTATLESAAGAKVDLDLIGGGTFEGAGGGKVRILANFVMINGI